MEKQLKDYLHLYLGCEIEYVEKLTLGNSEKRKAKSYGLDDKYVNLIPISFKGELSSTTSFRRRISDIKPILRPLSDMSEQEKQVYEELQGRTTDFVHKVVIKVDIPRSFKWLLDNHFDLFGLVESGLAIDKTKL